MKASPADQRLLLDIADLDDRMSRADHARKNPSQAARVKELVAARTDLSHELTLRQGARDDLRAELARIESDVAVVDARSARDAQRLASSSNSKEAQGLESEIASLARRKNDLEDAELDVMDRLEQADAAVAEQEKAISDVNSEGSRLSAEAKATVAEASATLDAAGRDRTSLASQVPADLLALYDRLSVRAAGAGLLARGTCGSCHMVLAGTDLQAVRVADDDAVLTCPECGCILVRTEQSGL